MVNCKLKNIFIFVKILLVKNYGEYLLTRIMHW